MLVLCGAQAIAQSSTLQVWMDENVEVTADGTTVTYLTIYQYDPELTYMAFNLELALPKGIKINQKRSGREYVNDIALSERATSGHTIMCNMPNDYTLKVACFSENLEFYPDNAEGVNPYYPICTIGLVADPSTYNGTYQIEMSGVIFARVIDGEVLGSYLDHTEYCNMVVTGGTDFPGVLYTLPESGLGTMIVPFDSEIPENLSVYTCVGISGSEILLNKEPEIIANTPYVVKGVAGSYSLNGDYKGLKPTYSTEYMTGVYVETSAPVESYVIASDSEMSFTKVATAGEAVVSPNHCYINAGDYGDMLTVDNMVSGIEDVSVNSDVKVDVYNVLGQLIRANVMQSKALNGLIPGVYMINGNKYIVK